MQLVSSADGVTPVTGKTGADVTATFWKADNSYSNYAGTATLTEGTTGAFGSAGVYQLAVPSAATGVLGPLIVAVSCTGAKTYKSEILEVVAYLESDTYGQVSSVKAKTDNLPSDPADESLLEAALSGVSVDLDPVLDELAAVSSTLASITADISRVNKTVAGHSKLHTTGPDANRVVVYEDGTYNTPLFKLECKDQDGAGTSLATNIYEIIPVAED